MNAQRFYCIGDHQYPFYCGLTLKRQEILYAELPLSTISKAVLIVSRGLISAIGLPCPANVEISDKAKKNNIFIFSNTVQGIEILETL
jgi:hypothetical protein